MDDFGFDDGFGGNDFDFADEFDEFNDWDATACANGDYNTWEEEQVFQDHEGYEYSEDYDEFEGEAGADAEF